MEPRAANDKRLGNLRHALLAAAFGDLAPKPFRFMEPRRGRPFLVGYCAADKAVLLAQAQTFADPAATEAVGLSTLVVKSMPTEFVKALRLGFEVRARPVVRPTRNDSIRPGREMDCDWLVHELAKGGAIADKRSLWLVAIRRARLLRRAKSDDEGQRPSWQQFAFTFGR